MKAKTKTKWARGQRRRRKRTTMLQTQNRFESLWAAFKLNIESIEHKTAKRLNYALMMSATVDNSQGRRGWRDKGVRGLGREDSGQKGFLFQRQEQRQCVVLAHWPPLINFLCVCYFYGRHESVGRKRFIFPGHFQLAFDSFSPTFSFVLTHNHVGTSLQQILLNTLQK